MYPVTLGSDNGALVLGQGSYKTSGWYAFIDNTHGDVQFNTESSGADNRIIASAVVELNKWQHFVFVKTASNAGAIYKNGAVVIATTGLATSGSDTTDPFGISGYASNHQNGRSDEVRISNNARSANWIWAEYMNMASNTVFNSYGAVSVKLAGTSCYFR